jgi:hypothetical protein
MDCNADDMPPPLLHPFIPAASSTATVAQQHTLPDPGTSRTQPCGIGVTKEPKADGVCYKVRVCLRRKGYHLGRCEAGAEDSVRCFDRTLSYASKL